MEPNWQRIRFMPATPLGADGTRVTGCEAHIALSRRAATEGMVLLKNENETLPLKHGTRVAVEAAIRRSLTSVRWLRGFVSSRGKERSRFLSRWSGFMPKTSARSLPRVRRRAKRANPF